LRLVIAGDDEDAKGYARYLRELTGGDPRLLFVGTVGGQVKEELLSSALLYVTPSKMEGLPIALLEAMAHGRCCLASSIPSHQEIIEAGRDGLLFEWNDFDQFVNMLEDVLARSDSYRQALGKGARRKVCEKYSWESVTDATECLYDSLLAHNHSEG